MCVGASRSPRCARGGGVGSQWRGSAAGALLLVGDNGFNIYSSGHELYDTNTCATGHFYTRLD